MDGKKERAHLSRERSQSSPLESAPSTASQASESARNTAFESGLADALESVVGSGNMSSSDHDAQEPEFIVESTQFTLPIVNGKEGFE